MTKAHKPWAKLDFDFFEDEKVMLLEKHSVRDAYTWCKLVAMWADFPDARIDMADEGTALKVRTKLRMSGKAVYGFFDRLAVLGLIVPDFWRDLKIVTNRRAADDAANRQNRVAGGSKGGKASKKETGG